METGRTLDASNTHRAERGDGAPRAGLVVIFEAGRPALRATPIGETMMVLGRGSIADVVIEDARLSRRHAEVAFTGGAFRVRDLDSHNGTFVDGERATITPRDGGRVLRAGDTLALLVEDVRPFLDAAVELDRDVVIGPTLAPVWRRIDDAARAGGSLHVHGETGSGKELAARRFHAKSGRPEGPFVAVNCAAIPVPLAERLLFGARRGAYSGADGDAEGHFQAADGGTLFLDEIGELPADVQAKLLRAIETGEATPLGAARARRVSVRICSATHADLRTAAGFRQDLYYRLGRPSVELPPLRERAEELPWLAQRVVGQAQSGLTLHVTLVEELVRRAWPGNVRELRTELAEAARRAGIEGSALVRRRHLDDRAGVETTAAQPRDPLAAGTVEEALRAEQGNVTAAARRLQVHRNQLRRWLAEHRLDPARFR